MAVQDTPRNALDYTIRGLAAHDRLVGWFRDFTEASGRLVDTKAALRNAEALHNNAVAVAKVNGQQHIASTGEKLTVDQFKDRLALYVEDDPLVRTLAEEVEQKRTDRDSAEAALEIAAKGYTAARLELELWTQILASLGKTP